MNACKTCDSTGRSKKNRFLDSQPICLAVFQGDGESMEAGTGVSSSSDLRERGHELPKIGGSSRFPLADINQ